MASDVLIEWSSDVERSEDELSRIDCLPDGADIQTCHKRGCIWSSVDTGSGAPRCYLNISKYQYIFVSETERTINIKRTSDYQMFSSPVAKIKVDIVNIRDDLLQVKFYAENRYEVPVRLDKSGNATNPLYEIEYNRIPGEMFSVKIKRKKTGVVIWDTSLGGLVFEDQYLQLVSRVPSKNLYGFGENRHFSYRHDFSYKTWPMFSRDQAPGAGDYSNLYGVHPYYLCVENNLGHSHGVLLLNSNAMEITLIPTPAIIYRTTGGILDFYIILGHTPEDVTRSYTQLIGRPYLPAYWSLGFQLSRYGYENIDNMKAAVHRTVEAKIPLDVQYGDIDHFKDNKDFTWDPERFPHLPEYFDELHTKGIRTIIILDPAIIATDKQYEPYTRAGDIFIKWPHNISHPDIKKFNSSAIHGYVWPPGPCVFPDYFDQEAKDWWKSEILRHRENLKFDGLWIDMNEPANFGTNEERPWNWPSSSPETPWSLKCPVNRWDDPPYRPGSVYGTRLSDKTLCMIGEHHPQDGLTYREYDLHSLYGWSQTRPTLEAIQKATGERGVVISRSTYIGSGTMAGHWLGDNDSTWEHLRHSIIGLLEFNLFGIPYIGADICGYFGNVTSQLCQRWIQLGAFYAFSRNHNGRYNLDQDPAVFGAAVAESSRQVLNIRYALLPYLYTLFYKAHVFGDSVIRPLLHEFYEDVNTLDIDTQFLWGPALLISPVLEENATSLDVYMPRARWYDYYTGLEVKMPSARARYVTVDAPLYRIPLHIRGGYLLPTQKPANNTKYGRTKPMGLTVAPDESGFATGDLFWDDGVSLDSIKNGTYHFFSYQLSNYTLRMIVVHTCNLTLPKLDTVRMFGVDKLPEAISILIDNRTVNYDMEHALYNEQTKELFLRRLDIYQDRVATGWQISISL